MTKQIKNKVFAFFTFYDIQSFPYYTYTVPTVKLNCVIKEGVYTVANFIFLQKFHFGLKVFATKKKGEKEIKRSSGRRKKDGRENLPLVRLFVRQLGRQREASSCISLGKA